MKLSVFIKNKNIKIIIEHDEKVGYYVYIYDMLNKSSYDYLYDTLDQALDFIKKKSNIIKDSWETLN